MARGLVFGLRYDGSWYGPCGHTRTEARRIAAERCSPSRVIVEPQKSGAIKYIDPTTDTGGMAVWIPGHLIPGGHEPDVDAWLDPLYE